MEMELGIIDASLKLRQRSRDSRQESHLYNHKMDCMMDSCNLARDTLVLLQEYHEHVGSRHTLLRRAAGCFPHANSGVSHVLAGNALRIFRAAQDPCRYKKLLSSSDLGLPPDHTADAAAGGHHLHLVGVDGLMKKLLRWLTASGRVEASMSLSVMLIVGPTGIGKTTLVAKLYRQLQCRTGWRYDFDFQCSAACRLSRSPDRNELLLKNVLEQISGVSAPAQPSDQSHTTTLELLVQRISEILRDKRYFIIIDDMLEASDWGKIMGAFPNNNSGSRVLITTRFGGTQWSGSSYFHGLVHKMKPLNEIDSESLLCTRAFGSVNASCPEILKPFFAEILRRCEGIPFFISAMADWLKHQKHQQISSFEVGQVPHLLKELETPISRTYNDLPYESRLLSLYVSMFPQGYMFNKDRLVTKWVYEGLSHGDGLVSMDYFSDLSRHFADLVDRSVITQVAANNSNSDEVEACKWQVNDFILQFLASKSAEKGFVYTSATLKLAAESRIGSGTKAIIPRRLAFHHPDPRLPSLLATMDLLETRSLLVSGAVDGISLDKFVYLVVLDLEGWENLKDEHLLQICSANMVLLTYLSIRNTPVSNLPIQIKELSGLRILDVSLTQISKLPQEACELDLRNLDLRNTQIGLLPNQIVWLQSLQNLLVGGEGMINSVKKAATIPENICHVHSLETIETADLCEFSPSSIMALGELKNLKVLAITWSSHQCTDGGEYASALKACIQKWKHLKSLTIYCRGCWE